ncbi:hypothetical protein NXW38_08835 [Bacteroides ovatus]|nr:hypothetical protein [Bacteroides ovatus]
MGGYMAIAGYASLCVLAGVVSFRVAMLRRQKRISDEKTCFFIHTAHDVRTPLTLIKAPLEEVVEKDMVKAEGMDNVRIYPEKRGRTSGIGHQPDRFREYGQLHLETSCLGI